MFSLKVNLHFYTLIGLAFSYFFAGLTVSFVDRAQAVLIFSFPILVIANIVCALIKKELKKFFDGSEVPFSLSYFSF